jgi:sugar diacid utilization regulator
MKPDVPLRRFANACWWLLRALNHEEIINALVNSARELSGADAVLFAHREGDELRVTASSGLSNREVARAWRAPVEQGVAGWVIAHGVTATVADHTDDPRTGAEKTIFEAEGARSAVVIPVRGLTEVIGALCLLHRSPVDPDQWPMEALELLVRQAVSLDVVTAFELQRLAAKAAETTAEELRRIEGLPGLVARAVVSKKGLSGGLQLIGQRLGATVVLVGPDGTVLTEAEAVDAAPAGPERLPLQLGVDVEAANTQLGQLRVHRRRALRSRERHALSHCASIIALELLRQRSALETEERLGCDLFRELLGGPIADEGSLRHRASLLGVSLTLPRAVVRVGRHVTALKRGQQAELGERDLCSLVGNARNLGLRITGWISDSDLLVVIDMPGDSDRDIRQLTGRLLKAVALSVGLRLAAGVGRLCTTISDYGRASAEAEMALAIARARPSPNEIVTRSELGICALLVASTDAGELINMVVGVLGPLLASDARSGSDYVHTLKVFHACHRHVATAAEQLHVHVNTLRHRLRRIEELLGVDLDDADTRFMLELALRVHETVQPAGAA